MDIFLEYITDSILFEQHNKTSPFNSTHCIVLYPQNGDRIVTTDSATPLHPVIVDIQWYNKAMVYRRLRPRHPYHEGLI